MPQLHFSVDEVTAEKLRERAAAEGMTLSRYIAQLVRERMTDRWPDGFLATVIGSCADAPLTEAGDLDLDDVEL